MKTKRKKTPAVPLKRRFTEIPIGAQLVNYVSREVVFTIEYTQQREELCVFLRNAKTNDQQMFTAERILTDINLGRYIVVKPPAVGDWYEARDGQSVVQVLDVGDKIITNYFNPSGGDAQKNVERKFSPGQIEGFLSEHERRWVLLPNTIEVGDRFVHMSGKEQGGPDWWVSTISDDKINTTSRNGTLSSFTKEEVFNFIRRGWWLRQTPNKTKTEVKKEDPLKVGTRFNCTSDRSPEADEIFTIESVNDEVVTISWEKYGSGTATHSIATSRKMFEDGIWVPVNDQKTEQKTEQKPEQKPETKQQNQPHSLIYIRDFDPARDRERFPNCTGGRVYVWISDETDEFRWLVFHKDVDAKAHENALNAQADARFTSNSDDDPTTTEEGSDGKSRENASSDEKPLYDVRVKIVACRACSGHAYVYVQNDHPLFELNEDIILERYGLSVEATRRLYYDDIEDEGDWLTVPVPADATGGWWNLVLLANDDGGHPEEFMNRVFDFVNNIKNLKFKDDE